MDSNLVNTQIILMRKVVRSSKRFVYQKLFKKIKRFEFKRKQIDNKELKTKYENKIRNKSKELIAIKAVNVDEVSKEALIHEKSHFEDIIKNSQTSVESKALARIAVNDSIGKAVIKFKDENPDCDQWLSSQIELWQQKKAMKRNKIREKKGLPNEEITQSDSKTSKVSKAVQKDKQKKKSVVSEKKKKPKSEKKIESNVKQNKEIEETVEKPKSDPFFLSDDIDVDDESDDNITENERQMNTKKSFKTENFKRNKERISNRFQKSHSNSKNFNKNANKFEKNYKTKQSPKSTGPESDSGEVLHPSWAAKRSVKNKFKIDLNQKPLAKKIKFNDN